MNLSLSNSYKTDKVVPNFMNLLHDNEIDAVRSDTQPFTPSRLVI